jgi:hypothetical protein
MSERRKGSRFITDLTVAIRSERGVHLDDRATAHDVSVKGFKLETQADLKKDQHVSFTLELPRGRRAPGRGVVVWAKRETFATWAGVKIVKLAWTDKRRIAKLIDPDQVDWPRIGDLALKAVFAVVVVGALQKALQPGTAASLGPLLPKFVAIAAMAWALMGLLKR